MALLDFIPQELPWWEALLARLSGPENAIVRGLIAGHADLPDVAFTVLARDTAPEVRRALLYNDFTPVNIIQSLIRDDTLEYVEPDELNDFIGFLVMHFHGFTAADLELLMDWIDEEAFSIQEFAEHPSASGTVLRKLFSHPSFDESVLDACLESHPIGTSGSFWHDVLFEVELYRLIFWQGLPSAVLEDFMRWYELNGKLTGHYFALHNPEFAFNIAKHPNATPAVFETLLTDEHFIWQDRESDCQGLRAILEHPNATADQRDRARRLIPGGN
jgi:hypothetical protein